MSQVVSNPRILIVEDERVTQELLSAVVRRCGMTPVVCENASIGLYHYIQGSQFAAVILDILMPGLNGEAFLRAAEDLLESGLMNRRSRIIVHTSVSGMDELRHYSSFECVHCVVPKPASRADLQRHLSQIVESISHRAVPSEPVDEMSPSTDE